MKKHIINLILFLLILLSCSAQETKPLQPLAGADTLTFASYNVENLFDLMDDPHKRDNEFLPDGGKAWNSERYSLKLENLSRVINDLNANIIGLVEVENRAVLEDLVTKKLISGRNYQIVHEESPDARGIDVAILFDPSEVRSIGHKIKRIVFPWSSRKKTRDILLSSFLLRNKDTLTVVMNHWPSRIGGQEKTEKDRIFVAGELKKLLNDYKNTHHGNYFIIAGDFNDTPRDSSLIGVLHATTRRSANYLFNVTSTLPDSSGSYIYRGIWYKYDQIIVSENVLEDTSFSLLPGSIEIFKPKYIVEQSGRYAGYPFRTYGGKKYLGGYSDHFPVKAKFIIH